MIVAAARITPKSRRPGYTENIILGVAIIAETKLPNDAGYWRLVKFMSEYDGSKQVWGPDDVENWSAFPDLGTFDCRWPQGE